MLARACDLPKTINVLADYALRGFDYEAYMESEGSASNGEGYYLRFVQEEGRLGH